MALSKKKSKHIYLIAGEESGDLLGGRLMKALTEIAPKASFSGIGGTSMTSHNLQSLFPMEELSIMGISEVLPKLFSLIKRINQTVNAILEEKPDVVITIDAPDFCFRVVKKLREAGYTGKCIHYVAPSVWAWRAGRAKKLAAIYDHVLCLLPFEPSYFEAEGMKASFIGHSVIEGGITQANGADFRRKHNLTSDEPLLCVLPGSRNSELKQLLPIFTETCKGMDVKIIVPSLPRLANKVEMAFKEKGMSPIIITDKADKYSAFAASTVALAASGTVALELGITRTPTVIGYRMNALSTYIARKLIKLTYVSLINIILDRPVMPEYLGHECTVENLNSEINALLSDDKARQNQIGSFDEAFKILSGNDDKTPSQRAAEIALT